MKILTLDENQDKLYQAIILSIEFTVQSDSKFREYLERPHSGKAIVLAMVQEYLDSKIKR
jgi:hypothetical protein